MSRAATAGSRRMSSYRMPLPNPQLPCKGGDWSLDICAVFLEQKLPSLAKEGWLVQATNYWKLNEPPRPRQSKERDHLLDGASTPPLPRRGVLTYLLPASAGRRRNGKFEM